MCDACCGAPRTGVGAKRGQNPVSTMGSPPFALICQLLLHVMYSYAGRRKSLEAAEEIRYCAYIT